MGKEVMRVKKVLWISRHEMTLPQRAELERIAGGEVELLPWRDTVTDVRQLLPLIWQADLVAAVLPLPLLAALLPLAGDRPVLQAESGRVPTGQLRRLPDGRTEPEFAFEHRGWQQVLKLELQTVRL